MSRKPDKGTVIPGYREVSFSITYGDELLAIAKYAVAHGFKADARGFGVKATQPNNMCKRRAHTEQKTVILPIGQGYFYLMHIRYGAVKLPA